jgi:hypothetical protein
VVSDKWTGSNVSEAIDCHNNHIDTQQILLRDTSGSEEMHYVVFDIIF